MPLTWWQNLPILTVNRERWSQGQLSRNHEGTITLATKRMRNSRKSLALALAVVGVAGLSMASAAQLTVTSTDVVAGVDTIANCDADGVTITYSPTYQAAAPGPGYVITAVSINDLNDAGSTCTGTIRLTLLDASNNALANGSGTVAMPASPTATASVTLAGTVAVSAIYGVAVAIG
jgi:hypothetical protein